MKHIDINSVVLTDFQQKTANVIDWAGFPPFIRGNSVIPEFAQIILKNDLQKKQENVYLFENKEFIKISSEENPLEIKKKLSLGNSEKKYILLNIDTDFSFETIALIRALRGVSYFLQSPQNNEPAVEIATNITEKELETLPLLLASMPDYLVCNEKIKSYIIENKEFIFSNTIDAFGGSFLLEEKTKTFLTLFLQEK